MLREPTRSGQSTPRGGNGHNPHPPHHGSPGTVREMQWLMHEYHIESKRPLSELRHCTSSLFVILSQRMFATPLSIYESPSTYDMKVQNIKVVLTALESILGRPLDHISPHEIVMLNERHIGYLIREFYDLALHILQNQPPEAAAGGPAQPQPGPESHAPHGHRDDGNIDDISEVQDEPSQADSAEATHQFVAEWKERVVPPNNREAQLASVRHSMRTMEEALHAFDRRHPPSSRPAPRPTSPSRFVGHVPASRPKLRRFDAHQGEFRMMTVMAHRSRGGEVPLHQRNVSRDELSAVLQAEKVLRQADREIQSAKAAQGSLAEATMAEFGRQVAKQRRQDLADLKRFVRDEDEVHRQAFLKVVAARRQRMVVKAELAKDELYYDTTNVAAIRRAARNRDVETSFGMEGHISDADPTDIVLQAKRALAHYALANRREMLDEYNRYRSSLTQWRGLVH